MGLKVASREVGQWKSSQGGSQVLRGLYPRISRKKGSFLRLPHVRDFVKEGYLFVPRYEVWGVKIPLQSKKYPRL